MSATVQRRRPQAHTVRLPWASMPTWAWVVISRAIVIGVGAASSLFGHRYWGWARFDPGRSSIHLGALGNVLAAGADRWDSIHYLQIAQHGYQGAKSVSFFPLYPLLIRALSPLVGSVVLAGVAISCTAFAVALVLLHRLAAVELGPKVATTTVLLLAFAPLSVFFSAVYTE